MREASGRRFILVSGRWDPEITVVDLDRALAPAARGNATAIVNRVRVTADRATADGPVAACGLPVSMVWAAHLGRVFVVNHAGDATSEATARMPHGHRGTIAVLDAERVFHGGSGDALIALRDAGGGGPVAGALTPDGRHLLVTCAEGEGTEDGGHRISVFASQDGTMVRTHLLRHAGEPSASPSPDPGFGRYPNPNGIAVTAAQGGLVFTGNGGTDDVSVVSLSDLIDGGGHAEIGRVPVSSGAFGLSLSPDGAVLAVADRESARTGIEGHAVSLVDVAKAAVAPAEARLASVRIGCDDPGVPSRPTGVAFSPDGTTLYATGARSGTLSLIDVAEALRGGRGELHRVRLASESGAPSMPRGVATTRDGRFVICAGGKRGDARSGTLWILDADTLTERGRVRGVGNEPYFLEIVDT